MRAWGKMFVAAALPLCLASCLWGPGKFTSDLALRKDGSFVLDYRGEILIQMPDKEPVPVEWSDRRLRCYVNGDTDVVDASTPEHALATIDDAAELETRPCTPDEIERQKAKHEKAEADRLAEKRKENESMAKMLGLPGTDDESNRRFAANLMKYQGWRSVTYRGKGLYDVDYHIEGRLTQDYAFPMLPDSDMLIPFIMLRRRADGAVMVTAPALTGGRGAFGARAKMMGLPDKSGDGPVSRAEGRFTIITDGEILTNNSEDGPVATPAGRRVYWDVGPGSAKVPEMLVRL